MDKYPGFRTFQKVKETELLKDFFAYEPSLVSDEIPISYFLEIDLTDRKLLSELFFTKIKLANLKAAKIYEIYKDKIEEKLGYTSRHEFVEAYQTFLEDEEKRYLLQLEKLSLLERDFELISETPNYEITTSKIEAIRIETEILIDERIDSLLSVFDMFKVNPFFPVLWIPSFSEKSYLKTHLKASASWTVKYEEKDTIFFSMILRKKTIIGKIYYSDDGLLFLSFKIDTGPQTREVIEIFNHFPLTLKTNITNSLNKAAVNYDVIYYGTGNDGNKKILSVHLELEPFIFAIMNHPLLSRYLSILETSSFPRVKTIRMRFRFPFADPEVHSFTFSLRMSHISDATRKQTLITRALESDEEGALSVLEFRVSTFTTNEEMRLYIDLLVMLIYYYFDKVQYEAKTFLIAYGITEFHQITSSPEEGTKSRSSKKTTSISRELLEKLDEFFVDIDQPADAVLRTYLGSKIPDNYSTICRAINQPRVLRDDKVKDWISETFEFEGKTFNRRVMEYRDENDKIIYLACPYEGAPFPGLSARKERSSCPCCFSKDQEVEGTEYYNYLKNYQPVSNKQFGGNPSSLTKVLKLNYHGPVPTTLNNLLKIYFPRYNFFKLGIPFSPNSFLHSILLASGNEKYNRMINQPMISKEKTLEDYVEQVKSKMADKAGDKINLLRDIFPELSDGDIVKNFLSEGYLNPLLYGRFVESFFPEYKVLLVQIIGLDIYFPQYRSKIISDIPAIDFDINQNLIILVGQDEENIIQWEPVIYQTAGEKTSYNSFLDKSEIIGLTEFILTGEKLISVNFGEEIMSSTFFWFNNYFFMKEMTEFEIVGQGFDAIGKCQYVFLKDLTIKIPPTSPFALKQLSKSRINRIKSKNREKILDKLSKVSQKLSKIIGKISVIQNSKDKNFYRIDWSFKSSLTVSVYILSDEEDFLNKISYTGEIEISNFENPDELNSSEIISNYRRIASRTERMISYLFSLYSQDSERFERKEEILETIDSFFNENVEIEEGFAAYDYSELFGSYPVSSDFDDALEKLVETGLVDGESLKIILPSEEVERRLKIYLKLWSMNRLYMNLASIRFDKIPEFYVFPSDFKNWEGSRVYVSNDPIHNASRIYLEELYSLSHSKVVLGPYNAYSLLYPCENVLEAKIRTLNWAKNKINTLSTDQVSDLVDEAVSIKIFNHETLLDSLNQDEINPETIYIFEEEIINRGSKGAFIPKKFYALLKIGERNGR